MATNNSSNEGGEMGDLNERLLEIEYENAKERLNQQQDTLKEFSQEGMRMFRLLLLFVAAPIAVLGALEPNTLQQIGSLLTSSTCAVTSGDNCFISVGDATIVTGAFLVLSAGANLVASGYEAKGIHNFANPEDVHQVTSVDDSITDYWQNRLKTYANRIDHNDRVISGEESLLAVGKVTLWMAIYGVATLAFFLLGGSTINFFVWIFVLTVFVIPLAFPLIHTRKEYREADRFFRYSPLYDYDPDSNTEENKEAKTESQGKNEEADEETVATTSK